MRIEIPEYCLVLLVGASGSGKTRFAHQHFAATEVISSDACRGMVSDDPTSQAATRDAFELVEFIVRKRLARRLLTVVDATNVRREDRTNFVRLAREYHALAVAIVLDLPERLCEERNAARPDRDFGPHVVRNHVRLLRRSVKRLGREGFRYRFRLQSVEEVDAVEVVRRKLWTDKRDDAGPFDIVGDVHGCFDELHALLGQLGYVVKLDAGRFALSHPEGRRLVFLGDLIDRGPGVVACLRLVMDAVEDGMAFCVPGNHETKLLRKLRGRDVRLTHGLEETLEQLAAEPPEFRDQVASFIDGLVSHYVFDGGRLAVAHAGMKENLLNRSSRVVRDFALFGDTTGETDEFGLPVRYDWAAEYRGETAIVYGHTPVATPEWVNRTICIDTGCVFGGHLTALRYPERELVSVPAAKTYYEPIRPVEEPASASRDRFLLDVEDVQGKRIVNTRHIPKVTVRAENAAAAFEVMNRYAVDPRWLIYLPPTMSPCATSSEEGLLEHPAEAFGYYRANGVRRAVCQEKHMGSRAIAVVCRDAGVAQGRFGIESPDAGIVYTRTGRVFFGPGGDAGFAGELLARLRAAADRCDLWGQLKTDWFCLDAELMPWSAKAGQLLDEHYRPVAEAARLGLAEATAALGAANARGLNCADLAADFQARSAMAEDYAAALERYVWPVQAVTDLRLAPFHLLASEGAVHADKDHGWHMATLAEICSGDDVLTPTAHRIVELDDEASCSDAVAWWAAITEEGGEGIVVKPWDFAARKGNAMLQPAVKCRGREYLRIIYGPEYTADRNLQRLRERDLRPKRSLARREFALGLEALARFVEREPLHRVHECVFAVLAMESEPVDPRL
ncbi:MAG: polynucleotide kinase-phosphatase [Gammaproteobacteria bacterium]|nr:polynucleotide kinase-phosphatase [Gammaproteobacteria bacterium]